NMATLTVDGLQSLLGGLGVADPIPSFPEADVSSRALDIFHSYLADTLAKLADCESHVAFQAIQWSTDNSNGDHLCIVIPRLRLKGVKPAEVATELIKRVRTYIYML